MALVTLQPPRKSVLQCVYTHRKLIHFKNAEQDQLCQVGRILELTKNLLVEFITKPVLLSFIFISQVDTGGSVYKNRR